MMFGGVQSDVRQLIEALIVFARPALAFANLFLGFDELYSFNSPERRIKPALQPPLASQWSRTDMRNELRLTSFPVMTRTPGTALRQPPQIS